MARPIVLTNYLKVSLPFIFSTAHGAFTSKGLGGHWFPAYSISQWRPSEWMWQESTPLSLSRPRGPRPQAPSPKGTHVPILPVDYL
jgi:hypothetical protein